MGMVEQCSHKMRIPDWIQLKYPMHSGIRGNEAKNSDQHSEMAEMLPFRSNPKGAFDFAKMPIKIPKKLPRLHKPPAPAEGIENLSRVHG